MTGLLEELVDVRLGESVGFVFELFAYLLLGSDEGDSVDTGHDSLFDSLPDDVVLEHQGHRVVVTLGILEVEEHFSMHHLGDMSIDVSWSAAVS